MTYAKNTVIIIPKLDTHWWLGEKGSPLTTTQQFKTFRFASKKERVITPKNGSTFITIKKVQ